jgi:DNA-binding CsgD family transcriptional regulator
MIGALRKTVLPFLLFLSLSFYGQIKHIGTPNINNYPKSIYKAGTQNWGICQDDNGFMYFANNEGVLIFNGLQWKRIQVSQSKPIRSIFHDSKNNIYIGLLNDFGMLQEDNTGKLTFTSLRHLIKENVAGFDDIWRIHETEEGIVFQTYEYIFILRGNQIKTIRPGTIFRFSFNVNGKLYAHEPGQGIFEYSNGVMQMVPWSESIRGHEIQQILYIREGFILVCTNNHGIYKLVNGQLQRWGTPVDELAEEHKLFSAKVMREGYLAFGTILNGLFITDLEGNILQHINTNTGLQNNTILSLYTESNGNLWLGLDNGIDYIEVNSPVSYFTDLKELGTGYSARVHDNKLYLGTNQGLFVRDFNPDRFSDEPFELVKNTAGQVWSLYIFNDQLVCGHTNGTFVVEDKVASKISGEEGAWKYIPLADRPGYLLGGHYNGLVLLKEGRTGWAFHKKIKGFNESCRFLQQSKDGTVWVSHGAKGIYRIRLNTAMDSVVSYRLYTSDNGLPSEENNIVFSLNQEIFISTIDGIYTHHTEADRFRPSEKMNNVFNIDGRLKTFETDKWGNIWYIAQNESGFLRFNVDSTYTNVTLPFKQLDGKYVNEFEFVYPFNNEHIFMGLDNGFAHYSANISKSYARAFPSFITAIEIPNLDSVINPMSTKDTDRQFKFPFQRNAFRFYFTSPFYEDLEDLEFSYLVEGYTDQWSGWSADAYKDLTNLQDGQYTFRLKARNVYGAESEEDFFAFVIVPPWYRTTIAVYLYVLFFISILYLAFRYIRYRIRLSRKKEQEKYRQELQKRQEKYEHQSVVAEKEIIRLRNEKLRSEMVHRDKELANQAMNIIQKNKFLTKLRNELAGIKKSTTDTELADNLTHINRRLEKEIDDTQQKKVFNTYFEEVNEDFFNRIKEIHPDLSPRELHLSAYIRMNLATKEIAALLNITARGVEISRYRLRKKLCLSRETNLSVYLSNI